MSSQFKKEASNILSNAPAPDAEASIIKEIDKEEKPKPKRGRPKGSTSKRGRPSKASKETEKEKEAAAEYCAKVINTSVFATTCAFTGTKEAWPDENRIKELDVALKNYFILKGVVMPPEAVLFASYGTYFSETFTKEEVKQNMSEKVANWKLKNILSKFKFWKGKKNVSVNN